MYILGFISNLKKSFYMKIDKTTVVSVLLALVVFKAVDVMFLDKAMDKLKGNFDGENAEDDDDFR